MLFQDVDSRQLRTLLAGGGGVFVPLALATLLGSPWPMFFVIGAGLVGACAIAVYEDRRLGAPNMSAPTEPSDHSPRGCTDHFIAREFAAAQRGRKLTLVMFGFSGFEEFSRREGARAASEAIQAFGGVLQRMTRQMNLSARYGWRADSFLSVLSEADAQGAEVFVRRVRQAAAELKVRMPEIEVGTATYQAGLQSPDQLVRQAEEALASARAESNRRPPLRARDDLQTSARGRVQAA